MIGDQEANRWTRLAGNVTIVWAAFRAPLFFVVGTILAFQQALGGTPDPTVIMLSGAMFGVGGLLAGTK